MINMIPKDFDVALICQAGDAALFAARRPDVWHFVLATTRRIAPNYQSTDIGQFHWPRYSVARALAAVGSSAVPELVRQLGFDGSENNVGITLRGVRFPLPARLLANMRKDLSILEQAVRTVKEGAAGFEVIDAVTSRNFPVVSTERCLADAIAFERETRKTLEPRNFGVYSAYCTWRDFLSDDVTKKTEIAAGMAAEMICWDPNTFGDEVYWESVLGIQERLWGCRIWGPDVNSSEELLGDAFTRAFERLTSIQFAQFVLMNGMHRGGPFHPLATLLGLIDLEGYKYWRTREYSPDSEEEQEIRTHTSFIELLGLHDSDAA